MVFSAGEHSVKRRRPTIGWNTMVTYEDIYIRPQGDLAPNLLLSLLSVEIEELKSPIFSIV